VPIRVRCPRCWETAEVPDDALGKRGVCNSCGAQVAIPAKLNKVCFICGADVTRMKHTKDLEGNYLCMSCFETRNPDQQASFKVPTIECSACHAQFAEGEGHTRDGKPVCRDCFGHSKTFGDLDIDALVKTRRSSGGKRRGREKELDEDEQIEAAVAVALAGGGRKKEDGGWKMEDGAPSSPTPEAPPQIEESHPHDWGKSLLEQADEIQLTPTRPVTAARTGPMVVRTSSPAGVVLAVFALIGVGVLGWVEYKGHQPNWENQNRAKIIALRAQGEVLVEVGKVKEGLGKYAELAKLAAGHEVKDADLKAEIEQGRQEAQRASMGAMDNWEEENRTRLMILGAQGEVLVLAGKYGEAMEKYDELLAMVKGKSISAGLAQELRQARAARQQAQVRLEQEKQAAAVQRAKPPVEVPKPPVRVEVPAVVRPEPTPAETQPHKINIFDDPVKSAPPVKAPTTRRSVFD
jgi:hypothetical protein